MSQATTTFAYGTQQQASALISTLAAGQSGAGTSTSVYQPTAPQTASTSLNSTNAVAYQQQNAAYQSMLEAHQRQQQVAIGGLQQAAYTSRPIQYQQQQLPDSSSAYSTAAVTASPAAANAVDTAMASYQQQLAAYQQQQQAFYQQQQQQQQQQMASLQQQQSAAQVAQQNSLTTATRPLQAGFAGHPQQQSAQGQYSTQQQTDQYMFTQPPPSAGASISSAAAVQQPPQQASFANNSDYYSQQMYSTPQPATHLQSNQHHMQANVAQPMYQDPSYFHSSSVRGGSHFSRPPAPYNENYMQHNPARYNSFVNSSRGSMQSSYNSEPQIRSQGFGHRMGYDSKNQRGGFTPRATMNFSNRPFLSFYDGDENDPVPNVIYISELPNTITNELLAQQFASAGPLATLDEQGLRSKVWIYKDKMTRAPRGDATITFQNAESAKKAISMFNGKEMFGKSIKVKQCTKKEMNNQIQIRLQIAQNPKNQGNYSSFDVNNGVSASTGGAGGPPPFTSFNTLRSTGANSPRGRGGYSRGGGYGQGGESFSDSVVSNRGGESNGSFRGENTSTGPMRQNQRFDSSRRGSGRDRPY